MRINTLTPFRKYKELRSKSMFVAGLEQATTFALFGGCVRSWLLDKEPRDYDIVVDANPEWLAEYLGSEHDCSITSNRFGGYKLADGIAQFDVWPLEDTWALKHAALRPSFFNMFMTASFNVDCGGIVVYAEEPELVDHGMINGIQDGIAVNYEENPHHMYNALRGLRIVTNTGIDMQQSFKDYIKKHLPINNIERYEANYLRCYGTHLDLALYKDIVSA
jgi:hypothetical protein